MYNCTPDGSQNSRIIRWALYVSLQHWSEQIGSQEITRAKSSRDRLHKGHLPLIARVRVWRGDCMSGHGCMGEQQASGICERKSEVFENMELTLNGASWPILGFVKPPVKTYHHHYQLSGFQTSSQNQHHSFRSLCMN